MTTFNTPILKLVLGVVLVLALHSSSQAYAATTFDGAMNQGIACLRVQDFRSATAWFASASRSRPNSQVARFWTAYAIGCQQAQNRQYAASAASWRRAVAICPSSAVVVDSPIAAVTNAANGRGTFSLDDAVDCASKLVEILKIIEFLGAL